MWGNPGTFCTLRYPQSVLTAGRDLFAAGLLGLRDLTSSAPQVRFILGDVVNSAMVGFSNPASQTGADPPLDARVSQTCNLARKL